MQRWINVAYVILGLTFYLYPLIEAATMPRTTWRDAGFKRGPWLVYLFFVPGIMTVLYLLVVRPQLRALRGSR